MMMEILKSVVRLVRILLAAVVGVIVSVWVEEMMSGLRSVPPFWWPEGHAVRFFACFVGSGTGYFFTERRSYAFLIPVVGFYLWSDWSRITKFVVVDWHPFEWYPFIFPSVDVVWLLSVLLATIAGLALGRFVVGTFVDRQEWRKTQPDPN